MTGFLYRNVLLPGYETGLKRRNTFRYLRELRHSQWLDRASLDQFQFAALQRLIAHTEAHCPFYRQVWAEHGLAANRLRAPEDFHAWPLTTRETIRAHRLEMRAQVPGMRLITKATGGSGGVPLQFDLNLDSHDRRNASSYRGYEWAGAGPGTKQFYLWGVPLGVQSRWKRYKDRLYNWLNRRYVLNSFDFREDRVPEFSRLLSRYRPDAIVAYTNPLYHFARALEERKLTPHSPKGIVVGAEKLHAFQREVIERVFQAPVFETYGAREFMLIGAECERHCGLHLSQEFLLVEILDDAGRPTPAGQEGNVVVTDLYNYGMPMIRYVIGDRAVAGWETCSCGRGLPLLKRVVGRQLDLIRTPDGRVVSGEFFPHLVKDFPAIERFQVVQERPDSVRMQVILRPSWSEADRERLDREVRKVLGPGTEFNLIPVTDIPLTAAGKHRVVISHVGSPAGK